MVTSPIAKSVSQRPASPTSFLELIASTNGGSKAKGNDKTPTGSFLDDAGVVVLKAHKAISIDDLSPLGVKSSQELTSSHMHKVLGESLYISGKYLDYEEKYIVAKSKVDSLSAERTSHSRVRFLLLLIRPRKTRIV
nr:hypothetical protein CFP56_05309 [Quercus suber]